MRHTRGRNPLSGCLAITREPFIWLWQNLAETLFMDKSFTDKTWNIYGWTKKMLAPIKIKNVANFFPFRIVFSISYPNLTELLPNRLFMILYTYNWKIAKSLVINGFSKRKKNIWCWTESYVESIQDIKIKQQCVCKKICIHRISSHYQIYQISNAWLHKSTWHSYKSVANQIGQSYFSLSRQIYFQDIINNWPSCMEINSWWRRKKW